MIIDFVCIKYEYTHTVVINSKSCTRFLIFVGIATNIWTSINIRNSVRVQTIKKKHQYCTFYSEPITLTLNGYPIHVTAALENKLRVTTVLSQWITKYLSYNRLRIHTFGIKYKMVKSWKAIQPYTFHILLLFRNSNLLINTFTDGEIAISVLFVGRYFVRAR
jgi:hypothetical protein